MAGINIDADKAAKSASDSSSSGNGRSKADDIRDSIHSTMKGRFKGDSDKAAKEAEKFIDKLVANLKKKGKTLEDIDTRSAKERREEDYKQTLENLKLEAEAADGFKEKIGVGAKIFGASVKKASLELTEKLLNGALNLGQFFDKGIDEYASTYSQYSSKINARLLTFDARGGEAFEGLSKLVRKNLAASPYAKQEDMLKNLDSLISLGISYNVEQRAFLATMTDKIVTTFNTLDPILLKMIRLQQMDSTQARMGMEALLTQYFNSTYEDTSYLNNLYDTVTENLFEASSQLGRDASLELEYVVQKWLGSMSSIGVGDTFITTIAQGLGYLGSGDVTSLASNLALQNLLVMASNRAGLEYSQILAQGLNADTANKLLSGIASYVKEISQGGVQDNIQNITNNSYYNTTNTNTTNYDTINNTTNTNDIGTNQVVRSQYAQLFGMSLSDMTAMLNLQVQDLTNISKDMKSYGDLVQELNDQLSLVGSRMHISEKINNIFNNFMTTVAGGIASNAGTYVTWKVVDLIEKATGGIAIPTFSIMGNMVDLETTVTGLIKTTMVGASMLGQIGSILGGLSASNNLNLANWGYSDTTTRGTGFGAITSGYSQTTSTSMTIGSSSGDDIASSSVTAAKDQVKEENKGSEEEEDILDLTKVIMNLLLDFEKGDKKIHAIIHNGEGFDGINVNVTNSSLNVTTNGIGGGDSILQI